MSKNKHKGVLSVIMTTIFLDVLGVGILIPVLYPLIYTIFIPSGMTQNEALIALGWLTAIYPLMQFLATPILGQLSDKFGRRKILLISLFGTGVGYALFAIAIITKNIPLLFFSRALDGVTGGNLSVARAVIADITPKHKLTQTFGLIGAMFGIGFVMGPYIGARLSVPNVSFFGLFTTPSWFGPETPFWFCAILSFITTLLVYVKLSETHPKIQSHIHIVWSQSLNNIKKAALNPRLKHVFLSMFLFTAGFTFFTTFFQGLLRDKLGFTTSNVGDFFAFIGICIAITQGLITPIVAKYLTNSQVLRFSFAGLSIALFLQLVPTTTAQLLMVAPLIALFNGLTFANATALISKLASEENQGEVFGIDASVQALGQAIPAIIAGYVATFGINKPVIVGATIIAIGAVTFNVFYKDPKDLSA